MPGVSGTTIGRSSLHYVDAAHKAPILAAGPTTLTIICIPRVSPDRRAVMFIIRQSGLVAALFAAAFFSMTQAYTWPNPRLDELESQIYDRRGYRARGLTGGVTPCNFFILGPQRGRTNAADWLRTVSQCCSALDLR